MKRRLPQRQQRRPTLGITAPSRVRPLNSSYAVASPAPILYANPNRRPDNSPSLCGIWAESITIALVGIPVDGSVIFYRYRSPIGCSH